MAEIVEDGGKFYRRQAGSSSWEEVPAEVAEAEGMSRGGRALHSLGRGAESLMRGAVSILDEYVGDLRGPLAPESAADNRARLEELQRESAAMGEVDPRAGVTAYAPEVAGAFVPGGLPAAIGTEAAIGAARNPDDPLLGAAIGGGLTALGGAAGPMVARAGRAVARPVRGFARGAIEGEGLIGQTAQRLGLRRAASEARDLSAARAPSTASQRPLEGLLSAEDASAVGLPLTRGDRLALDALDAEEFAQAATARSREELFRGSEIVDALAGGVEQTRQGQQAWLTSRLAQELGDPTATNLTPAARQRIRADVQDVFKANLDENPDVGLLDDLTDNDLTALDEIANTATPNAADAVRDQVKDISEAWMGRDRFGDQGAQFLKERRSRLNKLSEKAFANGNYELGSSLSQVREVVEDVLERKMAPEAREAIAQARKRWRVLKAMERTNAVDPAGEINTRTFLNAYKSVTPAYKRLTKGSRGDLEAELETLDFLQRKVHPDSGTSYRLLAGLSSSRGLTAAGAAGAGLGALFDD